MLSPRRNTYIAEPGDACEATAVYPHPKATATATSIVCESMATLDDLIDLKPLLTATGGCRDASLNDAICQNMICLAQLYAELQGRLDLLPIGGGGNATETGSGGGSGDGPHGVLALQGDYTQCNVVVDGSVTLFVNGVDGETITVSRDVQVLCNGSPVGDPIPVGGDIVSANSMAFPFSTTVQCTGAISVRLDGPAGQSTGASVTASADAFCTTV